eukprot:SAG31_NODE_539_length_14296_cov_14.408819_7_plen_173_part_00
MESATSHGTVQPGQTAAIAGIVIAQAHVPHANLGATVMGASIWSMVFANNGVMVPTVMLIVDLRLPIEVERLLIAEVALAQAYVPHANLGATVMGASIWSMVFANNGVMVPTVMLIVDLRLPIEVESSLIAGVALVEVDTVALEIIKPITNETQWRLLTLSLSGPPPRRSCR